MSGIVLGMAFLGGLFLAMVIGANSASPSFGPATSAGAASVLRSSLIVGVAAFAGASLQGGAVSDTVGNRLVSGVTFNALLAAVILLVAAGLILVSILNDYPMPTAFTLLGSAMGAGVAAGGLLNMPQIRFILLFWLAIPFVAIALSYGMARLLRRLFEKNEKNTRRMRRILLLFAAYTAFTAGANQSGLVVGPIVNAVSVDVAYLLVFAGIGMLAGAWLASPRIIAAVSRDYSALGPRRATAALFAAGLLAQVATVYGVPVSFNEAVISGVIGSGLVEGRQGVSGKKILWTVVGWVGAFILSFTLSFAAVTMIG